jgi:hypothetical protein
MQELTMTASATDLARELAQLQQEFRTFSLGANFSFAELVITQPGGFIEKYRTRTAEIQNALARMR